MEYDRVLQGVEDGTWQPRIAEVEFDLDEFKADIPGTNAKLMEALNDA
jgi:urea carboxylase